ncbi:MAG: hypothetical protein CYPHOPRED_002897 [Cyphobasidiales sp. Tagirdzhanova-0007]|nr:MAG: hypothetical protein CYPHOPRED_002897 [Cyphobasidiales sp. Tagirdzhanova-0007]
MKIIHDLVINHTSDKHQWFVESQKSKTNSYRHWYIWRPPKYNAAGQPFPPNNWASIWGGSAWEFSEQTGEYYLHLFSPQQPDLNFNCQAAVDAIKKMMRFWLDKGINGFRLDAINFISKDTYLRDAEVTDTTSIYQQAFDRFNHGPRVHEILQEFYADVLSVGEAAFTSPQQAVQYVRQDRRDKELQMIFHTEHVDLYGGFEVITGMYSEAEVLTPGMQEGPPEPRDYVKLAEHDSWQSAFLSNHDQPRPINNILQADFAHRNEAAKLLCLFLCTQAGTLFIYQGEEIGMMNVPPDWPIHEYKDLVTQKYWQEQIARAGDVAGEPAASLSHVIAAINRKARDNARTPMPWNRMPKAGFTASTPWMRINEDNRYCNVADQQDRPNSIWTFWRDTLHLRKSTAALIYGTFELCLRPEQPQLIAYQRELEGEIWVFIANFD